MKTNLKLMTVEELTAEIALVAPQVHSWEGLNVNKLNLLNALVAELNKR